MGNPIDIPQQELKMICQRVCNQQYRLINAEKKSILMMISDNERLDLIKMIKNDMFVKWPMLHVI